VPNSLCLDREEAYDARDKLRVRAFPSAELSAVISSLVDHRMELISRVLILGLVILAAVLLFTPYEAVLEVILAVAIVAAVGFGFMLRSRRDIFYVRTSVRLIDADRNQALEHDYLAVKVELTRLWLLFLPHLSGCRFPGGFFGRRIIMEAQSAKWDFLLQICIHPTYCRAMAACNRPCPSSGLDQ